MSSTPVTYPIKDRFSWLWFVIGTLLGFFWAIPIVSWISPVFVLRFMRTQRTWLSFLMVWLSGIVTIGVTMRAILPMPLPVYAVTIFVSALIVGALPYLADRLMVPRVGGFAATLAFPMALTALDFLSAWSNPMGSIGANAYAQYGNLALMQLAAVTGLWGITFLVAWFGSVVNWAWERDFAWPAIRRGAAIYGGILLAVIVLGGARVAFAQPPASTVRVHGITAVDMRENWGALNQLAAENGRDAMRLKSAEFQDLYFERTVEEARGGAQLVTWPELALMVASDDEPAFLERARTVAREQGIYLAAAIGTVFPDDRPFVNKLIVVDPAGELVHEHLKFGNAAMEGFKPGDGLLRTFSTPWGTLSGVICNDGMHAGVMAQAGRNGAQLLLIPSLAWRGIDPIFAQSLVFRAIENGVTVVHQSDNGLSIVADPYGRIVAAMDHFSAGERVMVAQAPVQHVPTLYSYAPDLFGWLAVIGLIAFVLYAVVRGRQAARTARAAAPGLDS